MSDCAARGFLPIFQQYILSRLGKHKVRSGYKGEPIMSIPKELYWKLFEKSGSVEAYMGYSKLKKGSSN